MSVSHEQIQLSEDFYLPKSVGSTELDVRPSDLGSINVITSGAKHGADTRTIIWAQPWSGYVARPDVMELNEMMASRLQQRVVSVDNVGIGLQTAFMDAQLGDEVSTGNLDRVARAQWQAISDLPEPAEHIPTEVTLLGYSLGASIAAAQAKELPESIELNRLILFEGVVAPVSLSRLMARFAFEATRLGSYSAQNPDWAVKRGKQGFFPKGTLPRISRAYWEYPKALTHGRIFDDLREARERENITSDTEVVIVNGDKSRVSRTPENDELARRISGLGVQSVRRFLLNSEDGGRARRRRDRGVGHGVIDSAPKFIEALFRALN